MPRSFRIPLAAAVLAAVLVPAAAQAQRTVRIPPLYPGYGVRTEPAQPDTTGLRFSLAPGAGGTAERSPAVRGRRLAAEEVARLLGRLPPMRLGEAPSDSFAFPAATLPPPRTGRIVLAAFPPPDSARGPSRPTPAGTAPLAVVRRAPEGDVELGAEITVSFSQPMVPLTSVGALADRAVPATLSPRPAGRWRWIDVRTLKFEPEGRLPMATEFTVDVPAGTRSATGGALAEGARWTFRTPAPTGVGAGPYNGPIRLEPVMVVLFDQRVDPAAVLPTIRVTAGNTTIPVRLATQKELEDDPQTPVPNQAERGKYVAFRPLRPLPGNTRIKVTVGPGTPSLEGPRRTEAAQEWEFQTYGPMRVQGSYCGHGVCRPTWPWMIMLSNPIDEDAWRDAWVRVEPALPAMQVSASGNRITITGRSAPNTRYTVRLDPAIRDQFGQTLGASEPIVFNVGAPYAELGGPEGLVVLDPLAPREISVFSHDLRRMRLRVFRVTPDDWPRFTGLRDWRDDRPVGLPGRVVVDRTIVVDAPAGEVRETRIDVTPALAGGLGHAVVAVEALDVPRDERPQPVYAWVQSTRIGLSAFAGPRELTAWATSLTDGAPLAGATIDIRPFNVRGTADAGGVATLGLPARPADSPAAYLVARRGDDAAILPENGRGGYARWARRDPRSTALWYAVTDRGLYQPGEKARFKGWVRRIDDTPSARPELPAAWGDSVSYTVYDPRRNKIAEGSARLSPLGGFDAEFTIPEGANLGHGTVELRVVQARRGDISRAEYSLNFQVQEFRRPEYAVTAEADPGPYFADGEAEVTARASYYAGGALPGAPVRWDVTATPGYYSPPGWMEWRFGMMPEWRWWDGPRDDETIRKTLEGETDASGAAAVRIDFQGTLKPRPYSLSADATVTDVNRQTWTAGQGLLVHPADVYVGLKSERGWLERGDSLDLDVVVVDLGGKPVAGRPVRIELRRSTFREQRGRWSEVPVDSTTCAVTSAPEPVSCLFPALEGGSYRVEAVTTDARGRETRTTFSFWVWGDGIRMPTQERSEERAVELTPDRTRYAPGDTARLLVRLPFRPVHGLVSVRRNGVVRTEPLGAVDGTTATVSVPLGEDDVPNVHVQVDVVGATERGEARGVDFASGAADLNVPPAGRSLTVTAVPADSVAEPDAETAVDVEVRDAAGRPAANAEVALVVVDEAVLALSSHGFGDPLHVFYPRRGPGVQETRIFPLVLVQAPDFEPAPGTIVGRVVDARNGQPLGAARVSLEGTGNSTETDAHGRFRLADVERGTVRLRVSRAGYRDVERAVTVGAAATPVLRISLVSEESAEAASYENRRVMLRGAASVAAPAPPMAMEAVVQAADFAGKVAGAAVENAITVRTNFDPLAVFSPVLRTGADGRARLPFKLPSNLTRYRVVALAVEGATRYGIGESAITARRPLMVRPSAPRFLNFGDRFELPVVIQNQTDQAMEVDVAARADGVTMVEGGERVTVPAHDRVEVRLAAEAVRAGPAHFQVAAASGARSDAAEISLPVWTPATSEAFATYGNFTGDSAEVLPLEVPADAIPAFGGLEITTSSTALQELTDALLYLVRYPYECTEQISSRMMSIAALRDVLSAFRTEEMPKPEELRAFVDTDVRRLAALQNDDGGWGFWKKGEESWPYVSIHAAHALTRAREKGYEVPAETWGRALVYLREVPRNVPGWYPEDVRRALHAYALYVRDRMGDRTVPGDVKRYLAQPPLDRQATVVREWRASLPLEVAGWLLAVSAGKPELAAERDSLLRLVNARATETASTATFATRYTEGEYLLLHSERRTDGVILEALLAADRDNPLIAKTVRGLLGHRKAGRWNDTQENAWVLLALDRYFRVYEAQTPEFVARVWLGERFAGEHRFSGRTADRNLLSIPMRVMAEARPEGVTIAKEGPGRIYYRAGLRYAPRDLDVTPLQAGFAVERTYEAIDDPADVALGADGRWRVRAGARVRVTVTMTAPSRRLHVAMVDPLPAGFEPVNPELRGSAPTPPAPPRVTDRTDDIGFMRWWRPWWFEHQNLRDDRVEAFTSYLPAGVYTYSYVARATTPGLYVVPPPRAEEMYSPETFGRGKTERVIVEMREEAADR